MNHWVGDWKTYIIIIIENDTRKMCLIGMII